MRFFPFLLFVSLQCSGQMENSINNKNIDTNDLLLPSTTNKEIEICIDDNHEEKQNRFWITIGNIAYGDISYERILKTKHYIKYSLCVGLSYYEYSFYSPLAVGLIFPVGGKTDLQMNFQVAIQYNIGPFPGDYSDRIKYIHEPNTNYIGPAIMRWTLVYAPGMIFHVALSDRIDLSTGINLNCRNYYLDYRDNSGRLLKEWAVIPFPRIGLGFKF